VPRGTTTSRRGCRTPRVSRGCVRYCLCGVRCVILDYAVDLDHQVGSEATRVARDLLCGQQGSHLHTEVRPSAVVQVDSHLRARGHEFGSWLVGCSTLRLSAFPFRLRFESRIQRNTGTRVKPGASRQDACTQRYTDATHMRIIVGGSLAWAFSVGRPSV
jgi:hypothetical protein